MRSEVCDLLERVSLDNQLRAVVLHGSGRVFSVGYDLGPTKTNPSSKGETAYDWKQTIQSSSTMFWRALWDFPKPLIAAVHGYCLGGGCAVAMVCDLTISSDDCVFGEPEVRLGTGSTLLMPWFLAPKWTNELLMMGKTITADRAYEMGLINEIVTADRLLDYAKRFALIAAKIDPVVMELTKEGLHKTYERMGLFDAVSHHDSLLAIMHGSETPSRTEFERVARREGTRTALRNRAAEFSVIESDV
jgi:enoyl-CoA hydratase